MCTRNFLSKLISLNFWSLLVKILFLQKWVHLRLVSLLHNSTTCLLANGCWNICFYHYSFLHKSFPSLFSRAWSLQNSFSYAWWWLVLNTSSMISYLIFLNKFFLHLEQIVPVNGYLRRTLCKYIAKFI